MRINTGLPAFLCMSMNRPGLLPRPHSRIRLSKIFRISNAWKHEGLIQLAPSMLGMNEWADEPIIPLGMDILLVESLHPPRVTSRNFPFFKKQECPALWADEYTHSLEKTPITEIFRESKNYTFPLSPQKTESSPEDNPGIRHRFQGQIIIRPLNSDGHRGIRAFGANLSKNIPSPAQHHPSRDSVSLLGRTYP